MADGGGSLLFGLKFLKLPCYFETLLNLMCEVPIVYTQISKVAGTLSLPSRGWGLFSVIS